MSKAWSEERHDEPRRRALTEDPSDIDDEEECAMIYRAIIGMGNRVLRGFSPCLSGLWNIASR